ncbi:hypothetical protein L6164_024253 [Bauhinia variegata]|uniref:Uncharacterized protein n=1 Tax=Bauhinia variegata TaxID=167791 RepID=A0ACB9LY53_BAUVA|nr:hypothetical protein L6164_024253 [Bauhinia variegata]
MANRMKEDDRIEKIIRGLLKLPHNRRCINCNSLGPQYVCTTFWTFICTNCSGIHREFTHRVKSVSMAKFNAEEVSALEAGGNEKAKQIYFKEWDSQRHSFPDSNNMHRLRDFIKNVYVDRKFTGERSSDTLPALRLNDKKESHESRKVNASRLGSKSANYEERFERYGRSSPNLRSDDASFRFHYDERRSPRYAQQLSRNAHQRSPKNFEVVDDRFRDDEFRSRRLSNLESKLKKLSQDGQNNVERSQPPVAEAVGESIGKNVPSLQVGQRQKKEADDSRQNQKVAPSSGFGPSKEHPTEQKNDNPKSLINLSTQSQVSDATVRPQTHTISQSSEDNWATFELFAAENAPQTPKANTLETTTTERTPETATANTLESILFELSGPFYAMSGGLSEVPSIADGPSTATVEHVSAGRDLPPPSVGQATALPNDTSAMSVTSTTVTIPGQPSNGVPPQVERYGRDDSVQVSHGQQLPSMQLPSESSSNGSTTQTTRQPSRTEALSNQPFVVAPNTRDSWSAFAESSGQTTSKPAQDSRSEIRPQPSPVENKLSGRKELPEDLFTASYLSGLAPGWHSVQPRGSAFGMQCYPNAVPRSAFPVVASTNPFNVTEGKAQVQASPFPTMATLQDALPAGSAKTGLSHASSLGSSGLTVPQSPSYASLGPPQSPFAQEESLFAPPRSPFSRSLSSFASGIPAGAYDEEVHSTTQPSRPQRVHSFSNDRTAFGSSATTQQLGGYGVASTTPHSFSKKGGNPFE